MGGRLARRLLDAGHDVTVWNRTRAKAKELLNAGATLAATPADAAGESEVVITMVTDLPALLAVIAGRDGLAGSIGGSTTLIEMSTVGPAAVSQLVPLMPDGVGLLDAPVLGSISEAEAGTLRVFVGGPTDLVQLWLPFLSTFGIPMHVGPLGAGAAAKLVADSTLFGVLGRSVRHLPSLTDWGSLATRPSRCWPRHPSPRRRSVVAPRSSLTTIPRATRSRSLSRTPG
jgi:3-hydroxyisobutyrate dehydrogenase-like beta-hydroxyacid dehydrogenase